MDKKRSFIVIAAALILLSASPDISGQEVNGKGMRAEIEHLRRENRILKEIVGPLVRQAKKEFPDEDIEDALKKVVTKLEIINPYGQPLMSGTATVEVRLSSDSNINVMYILEGAYLAFGKDKEAVLTMISPDCKAKQDGKGEIVYQAVMKIDPNERAVGKPVADLSRADYIQIGFKPMPPKSIVAGGSVTCIFNNMVRFSVDIPTQEMSGDFILIKDLKKAFANFKMQRILKVKSENQT